MTIASGAASKSWLNEASTLTGVPEGGRRPEALLAGLRFLLITLLEGHSTVPVPTDSIRV
jgi:hypothetical protein